ncbi:MAG: cyclodeaminase [Candidatus Latescibacterota bacterium]
MPITVVTERELRELVHLDAESLAAVASGFAALATTQVALPPIMHIIVPDQNGEVDVKSAYVQGAERFAIKIAGGFWENPERYQIPSSSGQMVVMSARTGRCEAVLLDNGYLTDVRTAMAGALAAGHLARHDLDTVGQIGTGAQGRYQVRALQLVRTFRRVLAYDRDAGRLAAYAAEMPGVLGVEVVAAGNAEEVVRQSDLVTTSTPSREPYLRAEWLHPGLHLTAMGADAEHKQELYPEVLGRADRLVCDRRSQCFRLGELHHARDAGILSEDSPVDELGEVIAGLRPGRRDDVQITACDLTGVGVQDTAISLLAYDKALARGAGVQVEG